MSLATDRFEERREMRSVAFAVVGALLCSHAFAGDRLPNNLSFSQLYLRLAGPLRPMESIASLPAEVGRRRPRFSFSNRAALRGIEAARVDATCLPSSVRVRSRICICHLRRFHAEMTTSNTAHRIKKFFPTARCLRRFGCFVVRLDLSTLHSPGSIRNRRRKRRWPRSLAPSGGQSSDRRSQPLAGC